MNSPLAARQAPVSSNPNPPPNISAMLYQASGVSETKALWIIRRQVLPLRMRAFDTLRFLLSGDAFTAEWDLIRALANCRSGGEVEEAFVDYHMHPYRNTSRISRLLIGSPCRKRAFVLYKALRSGRHEKDAG